MKPVRKLAAGSCLALGLLVASVAVPSAALAAPTATAPADEGDGPVIDEPELPELPELPEPELPALPEVPELPEPELPELPEVPDVDVIDDIGSALPSPQGETSGEAESKGSSNDPALPGVRTSPTTNTNVATRATGPAVLPNTGAPSNLPMYAGLGLVVIGGALLRRQRSLAHQA